MPYVIVRYSVELWCVCLSLYNLSTINHEPSYPYGVLLACTALLGGRIRWRVQQDQPIPGIDANAGVPVPQWR